ncbi:acyl-CoA dehydrogenase [Nocardia sp. NPDC056100]|uniref:acyl-CoA dehydrogenase n=1 Tax=Nocardia sp. NPDC056100 TaxID=3345712 RepID=UPI0035D5767D
MAIAISEDHRLLAQTVDAFLSTHKARAAARELLETNAVRRPDYWTAAAELGLLGIHIPDVYGGTGYGMSELIIVVEQFGRHIAPGALLPTVTASAIVSELGGPSLATALLPRLVDGSLTAAVGFGGSITMEPAGDHERISGRVSVLGAAGADVLIVASGADLLVIETARAGVSVEVPANIDPSRPSATIVLDAVQVRPQEVIVDGRTRALAIYRLLAAAEAVGGAAACTEMAVSYAQTREQFGRTIGTFQAVKHHCANMLVATELATAAVWDAARAHAERPVQFAQAAAVAARQAIPAFAAESSMNIQVHGGIGFTWEHDAHLFQRRALALAAFLEPETAATDVAMFAADGVTRTFQVELPEEAERHRPAIRALAARLAARPEAELRTALVESGYLMPHWPKPFGIGAAAAEQLIIDEEFAAAGVERPILGITGWVILTVIQHGTPDQIERFVRPALRGESIWCQLFSEPAAGSDAAGIRTRARRTDGGWIIDGQKVWTSGAHQAGRGLATVRTDPSAPKHRGVTMMIIDMSAPGVEVRPLKMVTGHSEFNEVFLTEVFVPDADVLGEVNDGWTVARATMGNERVSIGSGQGGGGTLDVDLIELARRTDTPLAEVAPEIGALLARQQSLTLLNLRAAERALTGGAPGPEGNITKLVLAEFLVDRAAFAMTLLGSDGAFLTESSYPAVLSALSARGMTIAGGTSEITRNQIAERILGLPRDPLVK